MCGRPVHFMEQHMALGVATQYQSRPHPSVSCQTHKQPFASPASAQFFFSGTPHTHKKKLFTTGTGNKGNGICVSTIPRSFESNPFVIEAPRHTVCGRISCQRYLPCFRVKTGESQIFSACIQSLWLLWTNMVVFQCGIEHRACFHKLFTSTMSTSHQCLYQQPK